MLTAKIEFIDYKDLGEFLYEYPIACTQYNLNVYLEMNVSDYKNMSMLIKDCKKAQNNKMFDAYLNINKSDSNDKKWLIRNCSAFEKYCHNIK